MVKTAISALVRDRSSYTTAWMDMPPIRNNRISSKGVIWLTARLPITRMVNRSTQYAAIALRIVPMVLRKYQLMNFHCGLPIQAIIRFHPPNAARLHRELQEYYFRARVGRLELNGTEPV